MVRRLGWPILGYSQKHSSKRYNWNIEWKWC